MPNTASAKKRLRQNLLQRARNRAIKSQVRKQVRTVREAVAAGDIDKASQEYRIAAQQLDRAGARRAVHPNTAARLKSRLQRLILKAKAPTGR
jgi:small subunit ribosomal protein S20